MPRSIVLALVLLAGTTTPALAAEDPHAVILLYHRFGEDRHPSTSTRLDQFEAHLEFLAEHGYRVLPLGEIVEAVQGGGELPDRAIAITIDDAYRSIYDEAFPRLSKLGWTFTVFVSTDAVDRGLGDYLTWDQIREMHSRGATFANHAVTHESLIERRRGEDDDAWRARVRGEIESAQARLEEELEEAPKLFAYPYGEYDDALAALIEDLEYTAFGQQSGAVGPGSDLRALPRFPMAEAYADLAGFRTKVATLPLAVEEVEPWSPVTRDRRPRLVVTVSANGARLDRLTCFVSGQGAVDVDWLEPGKRFAVRAPKPLPEGRSRYNCTAPGVDSTRYHWFSHPWVIRPQGENP